MRAREREIPASSRNGEQRLFWNEDGKTAATRAVSQLSQDVAVNSI